MPTPTPNKASTSARKTALRAMRPGNQAPDQQENSYKRNDKRRAEARPLSLLTF
jgi:hypothetical protein